MNAYTKNDLKSAWLTLSTNGTPPDPELALRVLPEWSVGIGDWIEQIAQEFLQGYCRERAHYKLVIAPYGGGKSHFLLAMRHRGLEEGFAVSYLRCSAKTNLGDWHNLFHQIANSIHLPNGRDFGIKGMIDAAWDRIQSNASSTDDPDAAIELILRSFKGDTEYATPIFTKLVSIILSNRYTNNDNERSINALNWLAHGQESISRGELAQLGINKISAKEADRVGEKLFFSLIRFLKNLVGVYGLVLLLDETDMMFNTRGQSMTRLMDACRRLIGEADDGLESLPVLGLLAAVPSIEEHLGKYIALEQRFNTIIPFEKGAVGAAKIYLSACMKDNAFLVKLGERLLELSEHAFDRKYDTNLQKHNTEVLAQAACNRMTDIDSRRLFVKAWCAFLDFQAANSEKKLSLDEANDLLRGSATNLEKSESNKDSDIG